MPRGVPRGGVPRGVCLEAVCPTSSPPLPREHTDTSENMTLLSVIKYITSYAIGMRLFNWQLVLLVSQNVLVIANGI